jgi:hypothetical protein
MNFVRALVSGPLPAVRITSAATLRNALPGLGSDDSVERAALAGFAADGVGWAFAGGYEAALAKLDTGVGASHALAALCATEQGGGHPRAIRTLLERNTEGTWILSGRKSFVTLGADADLLLVVAKTGEDPSGRNVLRVVRVPSRRARITLEPGADLPFAPEIGHAAVTFTGVAIEPSEILPDDGYDTVLKPFRTIEDVHVMAGLVGWSIGVARRAGWERRWMEEAAALLVLLRAVGREPPLDPATHVALAGALAGVRRLFDCASWSTADASTRERWERDRQLLDVASTVREARRETAWRVLTEVARQG